MAFFKSLTFYQYFIFLATLICSVHFFRTRPVQEHALIFVFVLVGLIVESLGRYLGTQGINNSLLYNVFFVHVQTVIALWYIMITCESSKISTFLRGLMVIIPIFFFINSYTLQNPREVFQTYSFQLSSFSIILGTLIYFYRINFKNLQEEKNLLALPSFWVNTFLLFFYTASFLYFSSIFFLYTMDVILVRQLNFILRLLGILMYLGLALSFFSPLLEKKKIESIISKD